MKDKRAHYITYPALALAAFLLTNTLLSRPCIAEALSGNEKPNILFIITDQQYIQAMSAAGNPYVKTPAMDHLAARGVRFAKSYCTYPICSPARASLVTSRMPHELGIYSNQTCPGIPGNIPNMGDVQEQLFDLDADPGETNNLVRQPEMKETLDTHRSLLRDWIKQTKDSFAALTP